MGRIWQKWICVRWGQHALINIEVYRVSCMNIIIHLWYYPDVWSKEDDKLPLEPFF
jgi:hypothetical protein